jgi:hypothetical protein
VELFGGIVLCGHEQDVLRDTPCAWE